jgi:hypothetical protein
VKSPDNYAGTSTQVDNPYCWQVALQQSLRPLQDYGCMLRNIFENFTNHFLPHYRFEKRTLRLMRGKHKRHASRTVACLKADKV